MINDNFDQLFSESGIKNNGAKTTVDECPGTMENQEHGYYHIPAAGELSETQGSHPRPENIHGTQGVVADLLRYTVPVLQAQQSRQGLKPSFYAAKVYKLLPSNSVSSPLSSAIN